jgi:hypothetical protein
MILARRLAFSLLGASTLLACGTSADHGSAGATGFSGTGGAVSSTVGSVGSVGSGGGATTSGQGGGALAGSGGGSSDGGLFTNFDASADASGACSQLNIGIFGNPGSNASSNFQQWLVMSGTSVQRIQTTSSVPLTAATLQPFDVVVLDWLVRDYSTAEAAIFTTWVTAGGGVASLSGYSNTPANDWHANSLLAPMEVAYSGPVLNGPVTQFATSPITVGLTSVTFEGGYAISDLGGTASTRTPIALLPSSTGAGTVPVGYAIEMGAGRTFMWGDEWIEFDSQWSTLPEIKQLWVQVFGWIAPTNKCALTPPS